ncbi:MAG TPA: ABC transporter ATP-binding protein [bacterium]|nr:ABC transporter ATP-binding protein [bacterium]
MVEEIYKMENLEFSYGKNRVIKGINVSIKKGDFVGIIGPNGSGKSTFVKILTKILQNYKGNVFFKGTELKKISLPQLSKDVSFLPSSINVYFPYTVFEFVLMGRYPHLSKFEKIRVADYEIVEEVLEKLGIKKLSNKKLFELSEGERQFVFLAQLFAQKTEVIILDEPISHLDIGHEFKIMDILEKYNEKGITIITILHNLNISSEYSKCIFLFKDGKILKEGKVEEVIDYKTIEEAYETKVIVHKNPFSGKPYVFGIPEKFLKTNC